MRSCHRAIARQALGLLLACAKVIAVAGCTNHPHHQSSPDATASRYSSPKSWCRDFHQLWIGRNHLPGGYSGPSRRYPNPGLLPPQPGSYGRIGRPAKAGPACALGPVFIETDRLTRVATGSATRIGLVYRIGGRRFALPVQVRVRRAPTSVLMRILLPWRDQPSGWDGSGNRNKAATTYSLSAVSAPTCLIEPPSSITTWTNSSMMSGTCRTGR